MLQYIKKYAISPPPSYLRHQWRSRFAPKTDRLELLALTPSRAYRPSRLVFSVIFFENRLNTG